MPNSFVTALTTALTQQSSETIGLVFPKPDAVTPLSRRRTGRSTTLWLGERLSSYFACWLVYSSMEHKLLGPDQCGAVSKCSAVDLTTAPLTMRRRPGRVEGLLGSSPWTTRVSLTEFCETGFCSVFGNNDDQNLVTWVGFFMSERHAEVLFEHARTPPVSTRCRLPQRSLVSSILFLLFLAPFVPERESWTCR